MLRFYVAGFIILLAVLFILLAVKFIKSKKEQFFTFGALLLVIAFMVTINILNPDAFIFRSNLEHYAQTGKLDIGYVEGLSPDATPGKIELYKKLQGDDKEMVREMLRVQKDSLQKESANWQSANLSRARALKLLDEVTWP